MCWVIDGGVDDDDDGDGTPEPETETIDYSDWTTGVTVDLAASLATGTTGIVAIDSFIGGQSDEDEILGPADPSVLWNIVGADEIEVAGFAFSDFQNLTV